MSLNRIGVVNRGEAAVRFLQTLDALQREGDAPESVALYTDQDAESLYVRSADGAVNIGEGRAAYLDADTVVGALQWARCDAAWLGWGFASEDADFAAAIEAAGIVVLGPRPDTMRALGDKIAAKRLAEAHGVPVAPWAEVTELAELRAQAQRIGFPLLLKAAGGGGGRGIRRVDTFDGLADALQSARDEARRSFRSDGVLLEKLVPRARHVEVQVFGDGEGRVQVLGVRDCSLQRRRQKVIEECPAPNLPEATRATLETSARRLCEALRYRSAGTVEFLYDPSVEQVYFLEVNTRLQVEHPVTEAVFGVDLVRMQIALGQGAPLPAEPPTPRGWAVEARLCAEDPHNGFAPAPGRLVRLQWPSGPGVRVDAGYTVGEEISPEFDALVAKIIAWGADRGEALARLGRALEQTRVVVEGGRTNLDFLRRLVAREDVRAGAVDTGLVQRLQVEPPPGAEVALLAAAIDRFVADGDATEDHERHRVEAGAPLDVYRLGPEAFRVCGEGGALEVRRHDDDAFQSWLSFADREHRIEHAPGDDTYVVDGVPHRIARDAAGAVTAPAVALVLALKVEAGATVAKGQPVAVLESMKMEVRVEAPRAGVVREVRVAPGDQVRAGQALMFVEGSGGRTRRGPKLPWESAPPSTYDAPARLRAAVIGWDIEPALFARDVDALAEAGAVEHDAGLRRRDDAPAPGGPPRRGPLDEGYREALHRLLEAFADVAELFERRPTRDTGDGAADAVPASMQLETLRRRGPSALGEHHRRLLANALAWHGIEALEPVDEALDDALRRLQRAGASITRTLPAATVALRAVDACPVELLDRLAGLDPDRFRPVCEAADRARYELFERPAYERLKQQSEARAEALLARLRRGEADWTDLLAVPESLLGGMAPPAAAGDALAAEAVARRLEWYDPQLAFAALPAGPRTAWRVGQGERAVATVTCRTDEVAAVVEALRDAPPMKRLNLVVVPDRGDAARRGEDVVARVTAALQLGDFAPPPETPWREVCLMAVTGRDTPTVRRYRADGAERVDRRDILPTTARRFDLGRLERFEFERLPTDGEVVLFLATARENPDDVRLLAYAEVRSLERRKGRPLHLPHVDRVFHEAVRAIEAAREAHDPRRRLQWNRITLLILPVVPMGLEVVRSYVSRLAPAAQRVGLEKVVVRLRFADSTAPVGFTEWKDLSVSDLSGHAPNYALRPASKRPLMPRTRYESRVVAARRRGLVYPYEIVTLLEGRAAELPGGRFEEYDLDEAGRPVNVDERGRGENEAGVVFGLMRTRHPLFPEGLDRVLLLSDPTRRMGALARPECERVVAAFDLAAERGVPVEWVAVSSGARIDWETGTENLDWTAKVLARIVRFTQAGGEVNIVVPGLCVGAQAYWNAEATMMMHTRGLLIMTDRGAMVLTGKRALDFSGCVSAEDDLALGGFTSVMGPNGQAQAYAPDLGAAFKLLYRYYALTYAPGGGPTPRAETADPHARDICASPYPEALEHGFTTVGQIFSDAHNPERKRPFAVRPVMAATADADVEPVERWGAMRGAETVVVWETRVGGHAATLVGVDNQPLARLGQPVADGPDTFAGGTLYPQAARKLARAVNAASGRRPVVVLANLSGFDGSPESLSGWQLEYGAEIGRAVVNFEGPIVFAVISRYHGGAYVVFSKALNPELTTVALEGTFASVIGGAPAAAVVFAGEVRRETSARGGSEAARAEVTQEWATRFDGIHTVERARSVGSIDDIIPPRRLRPYIIERLDASIGSNHSADDA